MKNMKNNVTICSNPTCSICMNEMSEFTFELPCQHVFHSMCLLKWISWGKTTCPLCRQEFMPHKIERDNGAGVFITTNNTPRISDFEHYRNTYDYHHILENNRALQRRIRTEGRQRRERSRTGHRLFRSSTSNDRNTNVFSLAFRKLMVFLIRPQTANVS